MGSRFLAGLLGLVVVMASAQAQANEPATANSLQLGVGFRYGHSLEDSELNPWGTGLGADVGYTLPSALYVGGVFDYFFGGELEAPDGSLSGNIWQLMAEGGYDLGLGRNVVLRPKVGAGLASYQGEFCVDMFGCEDTSETNFALAPGATVMLITSGFSLSLDTRYDMIFAEGETLNALIFSLGLGF
jgi:hypothetical protein